MRTAENRDEMLAAIKKSSGLTVDILSPGMESLFGAMGARSGYTAVDGLFMDLGGGSVQMTYVNSDIEDGYDVLAAGAARSLPFGAAKLTLALSTESKILFLIVIELFAGIGNPFKRQFGMVWKGSGVVYSRLQMF